MDVDGRPAADVLIYHANAAFGIDLDPQAYERIYKAEVQRAVERQVGIVIDGLDVNIRVEFGEYYIFERRPLAQHLGFESRSACSSHLGDAVVDFEVAVCLLCPAAAIRRKRALRTRPVRALFDHLEHAPLEYRRIELPGRCDGSLHQAVGAVHCADKLHRRDEIRRALGRELGGGIDIFIEQFDLIAAELLDVLAADARRRLREDLDGRAIGESAFGLQWRCGEELVEFVAEKAGEVFVHPRRLLARTAEDSHLAGWLEDAVEQGCDGGQFGFAPGAVGPDDAIGVARGRAGVTRRSQRRKVRAECVPEVVHRRIVVGADCPVRHVDAEEDLDVVAEAPPGGGPSPLQGRVDLGRPFDDAGLRLD